MMFLRLKSLFRVATLAVSLGCTAHAATQFEDTMAQRTLACTTCHGKEGRAGPDGYYPRIAGKPAGYLYNQLINLRDGRRHYALMAGLLDPLSDGYLMEIAQHFSQLDLPYSAPLSATAPADVLQRGRTLATQGDATKKIPACTQCHGAALTGVAPNIPGLLGLPRDYLNAQLGGWQTGQRRAHAPDCMAQITLRMNVQDVNAVAIWLATQAVPANAKPAGALPPAQPASVSLTDLSCGSAPASVALANTAAQPTASKTPARVSAPVAAPLPKALQYCLRHCLRHCFRHPVRNPLQPRRPQTHPARSHAGPTWPKQATAWVATPRRAACPMPVGARSARRLALCIPATSPPMPPLAWVAGQRSSFGRRCTTANLKTDACCTRRFRMSTTRT